MKKLKSLQWKNILTVVIIIFVVFKLGLHTKAYNAVSDLFSSPKKTLNNSRINTAQDQTTVIPGQIPRKNIPEMTLGRYVFVAGQKDTAKYSMNPMTKQKYTLVGKDAQAVLYIDGVQYTINKKSKIHFGQIKELAIKVIRGALVIDSHLPGDMEGVAKNLPTPKELGL